MTTITSTGPSPMPHIYTIHILDVLYYLIYYISHINKEIAILYIHSTPNYLISALKFFYVINYYYKVDRTKMKYAAFVVFRRNPFLNERQWY